jgi:hypothetical protein
MTVGRIHFAPEPITWHVPPSLRGWLEFSPVPEHPQLIRMWLKADTSTAAPRSVVLSHADIRRLCATLHRMLPTPQATTP